MNENHSERLRAFVLMPFDPEFNDVYTDLILPALEEVGYDVQRADDILNQENILKDIIRSIAEADLIIADLTTLNSNVLYELGISHALRKPTVHLTQSIKDIPFDLKSYRMIHYSVNYKDAIKLIDVLKEIGKKAQIGSVTFGNPVIDYLPVDEILSNQYRKDINSIDALKGEKGLWDFAVEGENSLREITESSKRIGEATEELGKFMSLRTIEINKIVGMKGRNMASRIRKKASEVAKSMEEYANKMEIEQPIFHDSWDKFEDNSIGLITIIKPVSIENKKSITEYYNSLDKMHVMLNGLLITMKKYRNSFETIKGSSRDLNRATDRVVRIVDLFASDTEMAVSYCVRILTLLEEEIEKSDDD